MVVVRRVARRLRAHREQAGGERRKAKRTSKSAFESVRKKRERSTGRRYTFELPAVPPSLALTRALARSFARSLSLTNYCPPPHSLFAIVFFPPFSSDPSSLVRVVGPADRQPEVRLVSQWATTSRESARAPTNSHRGSRLRSRLYYHTYTINFWRRIVDAA